MYLDIEEKKKGMTFDHDFGYSFPLFPPRKREEEKENEVAKIVIKSNAFLFDQKSNLK